MVYAWYVDTLGKVEADTLLGAPLPGTEAHRAAEAERFNSGLAGIYQSVGVKWES